MPKDKPAMQPPGPVWTLEAWIQHAEAVREDDQRALEIKQKADEEALNLARQQQTYKDEKANELREQISSERGNYINRGEYNLQLESQNDKIELMRVDYQNLNKSLSDKFDHDLKPLNEFVISQLGQNSSRLSSRSLFFSIVSAILGSGTLFVILLSSGAIK
jgi:hypothetical protein